MVVESWEDPSIWFSQPLNGPIDELVMDSYQEKKTRRKVMEGGSAIVVVSKREKCNFWVYN